MQCLDRVKIAGIPKGITDQILEGGFLIPCRHRHMTAKDIVNQIILKFFCVFRIIQKTVDVRGAVVKGREQKSDIRHFHDPVTDPVLNMIGLRIIAEPCLGKLHRADAAKEKFIYFVRSIKHFFPIGRFSRHIVVCMNQNNIIIFPIIIKIDNLLIKLVQKRIILKFTVPKSQKKLLGAAGSFLLQRELHIHQIFPDSSGKRLLKQIKIFKHFLLRERKERIF